jgi:hypothetical protein
VVGRSVSTNTRVRAALHPARDPIYNETRPPPHAGAPSSCKLREAGLKHGHKCRIVVTATGLAGALNAHPFDLVIADLNDSNASIKSSLLGPDDVVLPVLFPADGDRAVGRTKSRSAGLKARCTEDSDYLT